jgi:hypothetical protein
MTIEDEVKKCCAEIDRVRSDAGRLRERCSEEAKEDLSSFESKLEGFAKEARDASERGVRTGLQGVVDAWNSAHDRLVAHLHLIEAKSFLSSARRLAGEEDFVGSKNELASAVECVKDARELLDGEDGHLVHLERQIEQAVADIQTTAAAATNSIEQVVAENERLLQKLRQTS